MSEENKQLVRRWFEEVWNNGRADAIDEMFDENGIAHGLSDDAAPGKSSPVLRDLSRRRSGPPSGGRRIAARSSRVRGTVVTGMPRSVVISSG